MTSLLDYAYSSGSEGEKARDEQNASSSGDSYFVGSESESEDSATRRRREAEERLTNNEEQSSGQNGDVLPSPIDVIQGTKLPDFLKPEATRPLAKPFHRKRAPLTKTAEPSVAEARRKERDISSLAPKLKVDKREKSGGAVISAAAKKYKPDTGDTIVTAAQVAMLGGQWRPSADQNDDVVDGDQTRGAFHKHNASKAMPVSEFLAKGHGGSLLPRNRQDRKEKEKDKRAKGQSSVHGWKSEAEMVLRQQYD